MSCPEGLKPSVDYVTCEKSPEITNSFINGEWRFPAGVEPHRIKCLEDHDMGDNNSTTTTESTALPSPQPSTEATSEPAPKLLCENLSDRFFDETIDVNFVDTFFLENFSMRS